MIDSSVIQSIKKKVLSSRTAWEQGGDREEILEMGF